MSKIQKNISSHETKLTELEIKMKAFIVLNRELTKIKTEKLSKIDFDVHVKWVYDNLVTKT